jgi:hypothetical protein
VIIDYYLPKAPSKLTIDILDPSGKVVRSFVGGVEKKKEDEDAADDDDDPKAPPKPAMKAGLNRYTWDLHYPGYTEFKGMIFWAERNRGPMALPGPYQVRLTVDGQTQTQPAEVRIDPRVKGVTEVDLQKRFELATQIRDKVSQANDAVLLIRGVRAQIASMVKQASDAALRQSATQLDQKLAAIEGRVYQVRIQSRQDPLNYPIMLNNKLAALGDVVEDGEAAPTAQDYTVFTDLSQRLDREIAALDGVLGSDLPALNRRLAQAHLPQIERRAEPAVEQGTAMLPGGEDDEDNQ